MSEENQPCPKCNSPYGYPDRTLWICPECFYEWALSQDAAEEASVHPRFVDINGNPLKDGDAVTIIKDLRMGKEIIKSGTKVKNIRLLDEAVNDHDISCKIPGHGSIYLKCSVVKKA